MKARPHGRGPKIKILYTEAWIRRLEKRKGQIEDTIEELRGELEVDQNQDATELIHEELHRELEDLGRVEAEKELFRRELEALKHAKTRKAVLSNEILPGVENQGINFGDEESGKQTASDIDRHELINENIQPKGRLILFGASLELTEPPKVEDWENVEEICLMDNELSVLPENPKCPILSSLFLQRNYKLRTVPPSFFDYMPALEILNLSRTSIKFLPESIIRLVSLKRLFLNHCYCFMILTPRVGELKQLEVLDLEGTEIFDVPEQVKKLSNLICLELSLYGFTSTDSRAKRSNAMVSGGVISSLYQLEELNIDVNTADQRWNACVEAIVYEVAELEWLNTLKFYFPTVELLGEFMFYSLPWRRRSLKRFRFTVGDHVNRDMSRLTPDVEFELERWDRCLKYINGVDVPICLMNALQRAYAFLLQRHATVKMLSDFGILNLKRLKCCVLGECNEVQEIIDASVGADTVILASLEYLYVYYMKNLRSIWTGSPLHQKSLSLLKSLTLRTCPMLTTIFTVELLQNLHNLEVLTVEDCPSVINLVSGEIYVWNKTSDFLPSLIRMSLHYMPGLVSISSGLLIAPKLELVSIYDCPDLKTLFIDEAYPKNLRKIKGERSWWDALEWTSGGPKPDDLFVEINILDC
ncbi:hypothetical protein CJ030_MR2G006819 [Morella rubra]|uniref:Disease resistance protein RPS2 n=1 Tax=Morella rubra TaxID=262757 RepID=A0A6A1WD20_9ROSI|nr:hypothetical protein CJ030_MR2G006818 [Morella rubra]KAB1221609.1 hypothetical protein CJ030_MR2G006819 [Morella rubra]